MHVQKRFQLLLYSEQAESNQAMAYTPWARDPRSQAGAVFKVLPTLQDIQNGCVFSELRTIRIARKLPSRYRYMTALSLCLREAARQRVQRCFLPELLSLQLVVNLYLRLGTHQSFEQAARTRSVERHPWASEDCQLQALKKITVFARAAKDVSLSLNNR